MKKTVAGLLVFVMLASGASASQTPDQKHIEAIKKKVASCVENSRHVTVQTFEGRELQGSIREAGADSFVLSFHGNSTNLQYVEVKKIEWPSSLSKGLKTALLVVGVLGGLILGVYLLGGLRG